MNQLSALLSNWETYKNILEDFNSDKALGSAVRESQKDVASWTGQVTILKNNWDAFINSIANSDTAIGTLKALNGVLEVLKTTSKGIGGLGTVSTLIAALAGFKGAGVGSSLLSMINASKNAISVQDVAMLRQYNALLANGVSVAEAEATALSQASAAAHNLARSANGAAVSEEILARAENKVTLGAKAGAVAIKALGTALNMAINVAVVAVISLIVKKISELINKQKELEQQANEARQTEVERIEKYKNEANALDDVVKQYVEIISSTANLTEKKEQLLNLQEQIPDSYKDEADSIDLVNGKISENIKLLDEQKRKNAEEYVQNNQGAYEQALIELGSGITAVGSTMKRKARDEVTNFVVANLNDIKGKVGFDFGGNLQVTGTAEERIAAYKEIRNLYAQEENHNVEILKALDAEIVSLETVLAQNKAITAEMEKQKGIALITDQEYNMIEQATQAYREYQLAIKEDDNQGQSNALKTLYGIRDVVYSLAPAGSALRQEFDKIWGGFNLGTEQALSNIDALKADFDEYVNETYKEELKNLENIEKAINTFLEDGTLSHEDAWAIFDLDTEKILTDIQIINGQYKISTDQLVKLMQQRIDKQKESILVTKTEAEEQLALAKAKLASIKINSLSDANYYADEIQQASDDLATSKEMIELCNYLLAEMGGLMNKVERLTGATAKNLQAQVDALEAEVDAIDDTIDSLNDRKDVLNEEKDALQEQLDILNEQKDAIEETIKQYDAVADAVNDYVDELTDGIQKQIDALEEERTAIEDYYNNQIDALEKQNEERDAAIKKEKALADLANAKNQKKRIYSSARGWTYESDKAAIVEAQNALAEIETDEKIKALENERDEKLSGFDERKKEYEDQIKAYEDYAEKYADVSADIQKAENEKLADLILGSEWRVKIEQTDEQLLQNYSSEYESYTNQLNNLVNGEIADINRAIKAKEDEMGTVDKQIKAYDKYKSSVEKSLKEAQTALDNYKSTVDKTSTDVSKALETMEGNAWERNWKMKQYNNEMAESAESASKRMCAAYGAIAIALGELQNEVGSGAVGGAMMGLHLAGFANGGVVDSTGLAMLHGTKQKGEVIFNAADSKKLYDLVHGTPSLIANIAKQAGQIAGFNSTKVSNTNANSINVNIGQVVANNPQELTRNLDTHLDSYFRRKLTQSYTQ